MLLVCRGSRALCVSRAEINNTEKWTIELSYSGRYLGIFILFCEQEGQSSELFSLWPRGPSLQGYAG